MKAKKLVASGILAGIFLTAVVPTFANSLREKDVKNISVESVVAVFSEEDSKYLVEDLKVPSNTYILDKIIEDVTGV